LVVVSASAADRDRFVARLIDNKGALLSLEKVRGLLAGRVAEEELEERAAELLDAAVQKRLEAGETVVIPAEGIGADEREHFARMASRLKRPRHVILLETARDQVADEDRRELNDLRRRLDAGELGGEGFQTAMRLSGASAAELKRIVFQPAPRDD
jgi:predicted kinase